MSTFGAEIIHSVSLDKSNFHSYRNGARVAPLEAENKTRRLKTNKVSIYMPEEDEHLKRGETEEEVLNNDFFPIKHC